MPKKAIQKFYTFWMAYNSSMQQYLFSLFIAATTGKVQECDACKAL
jgi:hypothetical protein